MRRGKDCSLLLMKAEQITAVSSITLFYTILLFLCPWEFVSYLLASSSAMAGLLVDLFLKLFFTFSFCKVDA